MARPIDPSDPGDTGEPGDPGYYPPPATGAVLAAVVTSSNINFTADQILAAGGPWTGFRLRVTPINDTGAGPAAEVEYP